MSKATRLILAAALATPLAVVALGAQPTTIRPPPAIPPDVRIRITATSLGAVPAEGVVMYLDGNAGMTDDTLRFLDSRTKLIRAVALSEVTQLERSTGLRTHTLRGVTWGLLIGLGLVAATGYYDLPVVAAFGGGFGALGAGIGAFTQTDKWVDVSARSMRSAAPASSRGAALGVSFRF